MMAWYKYRQTWAYGKDKWSYIEIDLKEVGYEDLGQYLDDEKRLSNWSAHWRSIEWKRIACPPKVILKLKILHVIESIQGLQDKETLLIDQLKSMYKEDFDSVEAEEAVNESERNKEKQFSLYRD